MCAAFHNQSPLLLTMSGWDHFALFIKCKKHAFPKSDFRSDSYWPIYANFWIRYPPPPGGATTSPLYGIYADDTTFTSSAEDPCVLDHKTNYDVNLIQSWLSANILTFNIKKPKYMLIESQFKLSQIND